MSVADDDVRTGGTLDVAAQSWCTLSLQVAASADIVDIASRLAFGPDASRQAVLRRRSEDGVQRCKETDDDIGAERLGIMGVPTKVPADNYCKPLQRRMRRGLGAPQQQHSAARQASRQLEPPLLGGRAACCTYTGWPWAPYCCWP